MTDKELSGALDALLGAPHVARELLDAAFDALVVTQDDRIVYANRAFARICGYPMEEIVGAPVLAFAAPDKRDLVKAHITEGGEARYEAAGTRKNGSRVEVEIFGRSFDVGGRRVRVTAIRDITERKASDEALRRSEARLRNLIERTPDLVAVHRDERFVFVNPALARWLGYTRPDDMLGTSIYDLMAPDDHEAARAVLRALDDSDQPPPLTTIRYKRLDGERVTAEIATVPIEFDGQRSILVLGRDVTERKKLEARLLQADVMASLGTLAAGIAHETNNPLAYVVLNLGLMQRRIDVVSAALARAESGEPPGEEARTATAELARLLGETREGAERVRQIVHDFRVFARVDSDERVLVDLHQVLDSALQLVANQIAYRARLEKRFGEVPLVEANAPRLGQVFVNVLVNAADAIEESGHVGVVRVTTSTLVSDGSSPSTNAEGWAVVEIADDGPGIPDAIRARVFDPFFTTKPVGVGTGLGLSICQAIVSSLGGRIELETAPGGGTVCRLVLPPARAREAPSAQPATPPRGLERVSRRLRILVADDEPLLVAAVAEQLAQVHDVATAPNGRDAITIALEREFDVIVCDLMMPNGSGMEVFDELARARPGLEKRILFTTGGAFTASARQFLDRVKNPRLDKPFTFDALADAVARVARAR